MIALVIFFVIYGFGVGAQTLPAIYDVSGVGPGDVLNIRSNPALGADVIATLDPSATNVEIVAMNEAKTWGLLNFNERSGWASLTYLNRQANQEANVFPPITACYGTEPFWDIDFARDPAAFSRLGEETLGLSDLQKSRSSNRIDRFSVTSETLVGVIRAELCHDGMSDRTFGLSIEVLSGLAGETQHLSGCCTIQP